MKGLWLRGSRRLRSLFGVLLAAALLVAPAGVVSAASPTPGVSIQPASQTVAPGGSTTVTVQATAPASGLGAWTVGVQYDPALFSVTACTGSVQSGSLCNVAYSSDEVLITGASGSGLTGTLALATLTIAAKATDAPGASGTLAVSITTFTDPTGTPASAATANGTLTVSGTPSVAAPVVQSVSPPDGPPAGGTSVTIGGLDFTGASAVDFGNAAAASFTVVSATQITAVSPSGTAGDTVDVRVVGPGGESAITSADRFTYTSTSTGAGVSIQPASQTVAPGGSTTVTVQATAPASGLGAWTVGVQYDPALFSVTACTAQNGSQCNPAYRSDQVLITGATALGLTGTVPLATLTIAAKATDAPGATGKLAVSVTTFTDTTGTPVSAATANGLLTVSSGTVPVVQSVSPPAGPPAGGTSVTIGGLDFTGASAVDFGNAAAASFTVVSATQITAVSPAGTAGDTVDVRVVGPGGESATTSADQFTYESSGGSIGVSIQPASQTVAPGGHATVTVQATAPASGLGAWTVGVQYDPTLFSVTACTAQNGSQCNASYTSDQVLITGASAAGLTGTVPLATLTVAAGVYDTDGATGTLAVSISTFTDTTGTPVPATATNGTLTVSTGGGGGGGGSGSFGGGGGGAPVYPVGQNAGSDCGTLTTSDGSFSLPLVAGALGQCSTLSVSESSTPPSDLSALPCSLEPTSSYYTLTGGTLSSPQPVTIAYDATALKGLPTGDLSVWAVQGNAWRYLPTSVDTTSGTVQAYVSGAETLVVLHSLQQFPDVPADFWAARQINAMQAACIIVGFPDGTFRPDVGVTRAQFAKMIVLTLGLKPGSGETPFTDVPPDAWYAPYVSAAVDAGIVHGVTPTIFAPEEVVSREQLAVMITNALKLTGTATLPFKDSGSIASWALPSVEAAYAAGYLKGLPDGSFQPLAPVTRAQAAMVLDRVIAHLAP